MNNKIKKILDEITYDDVMILEGVVIIPEGLRKKIDEVYEESIEAEIPEELDTFPLLQIFHDNGFAFNKVSTKVLYPDWHRMHLTCLIKLKDSPFYNPFLLKLIKLTEKRYYENEKILMMRYIKEYNFDVNLVSEKYFGSIRYIKFRYLKPESPNYDKEFADWVNKNRVLHMDPKTHKFFRPIYAGTVEKRLAGRGALNKAEANDPSVEEIKQALIDADFDHFVASVIVYPNHREHKLFHRFLYGRSLHFNKELRDFYDEGKRKTYMKRTTIPFKTLLKMLKDSGYSVKRMNERSMNFEGNTIQYFDDKCLKYNKDLRYEYERYHYENNTIDAKRIRFREYKINENT